MKLLTTALVIILLSTSSAKPARLRRPYDADIPDKDINQRFLWRLTETSNSEDSNSDESSESSESSESRSSEESSEEVLITEQTTPETIADITTATMPPIATMTVITIEEGSTFTPEAGTVGTDNATVTETVTPEPVSPCNITQCVTFDIPTGVAITEIRGDN